MVIFTKVSGKFSVVSILVIVNLLIFFGLWAIRLFEDTSFFPIPFLKLFGCPASLDAALCRPWSFVTYSFIQFEPLHAILNISWLIWSGVLALGLGISQSRVLALYVVSAIIGALFYSLFSPVSGHPASFLFGSSASVVSLAVAVAITKPSLLVYFPLFPGIPIFIPVSLLVVAEGLLVTLGNGGSHFAHIGGIVSGLLFGYFWRKNNAKLPSTFPQICNKNPLLDQIRLSGFESLSQQDRTLIKVAFKEKTSPQKGDKFDTV